MPETIPEVLFRDWLRSDPDMVTSLRWLGRDSRNFMNKLVTRICRKIRLLGKEEKLDPEAAQTKVNQMHKEN